MKKDTVRHYRSEFKLDDENHKISGYALVFEKWSKDLGFREIIHKGAVTQELVDSCDIILNYNHNDNEILARSNKGEGTLKLTVDDNGLYFECDVPDTQLGKDLYYHIKNGNLFECSFCFRVDMQDAECIRFSYDKESGEETQEIFKLAEIHDVSIVTSGAYGDTSVQARNISNTDNMTKEEILAIVEEAMKSRECGGTSEPEKREEKAPIQCPKCDAQAEWDESQGCYVCHKCGWTSKDENREEPDVTREPADVTQEPETQAVTTEAPAQERQINKKNTMKKDNSLVQQIRSAMESGKNKFTLQSRDAHDMTYGGYDTTTGEGEQQVTVHHDTAVVEEEKKSIIEPLFSKSLINTVGATIYSGLPMGDVSVPVMSNDAFNTVGWAGETSAAAQADAEFTTVRLQPKRLTAFVDISKMLLATDTKGVNEAIHRNIVRRLQDKLEKTLFSADAGTTTKPAGLFYNVNDTTISTYANLCDFEATLEDIGISDELKYVANPKVKAYFRQMAKGTKTTQLVYENGEVDGTPLISTALIPSKKFVYGSLRDWVIGFWDNNIEVVVDNYSQATNGCVRLVVTMYADAKLARNNAIKFGIVP